MFFIHAPHVAAHDVILTITMLEQTTELLRNCSTNENEVIGIEQLNVDPRNAI